jgi:light-regulated signal transduction histidine kinase (bacteriophytochrome)
LAVLTRAMAIRQLRLENAELLARLQDRTAQLEAANEELESFSFSVSHDLRAPLRVINGFADILIREHTADVSAEARRLLGIVIDRSKQMSQLIEDLLKFSQLSRSSMSQNTVRMTALVNEVIADLRSDDPSRVVEINVDPLPDEIGDLNLLRQVLVNLLSNALKFTRGKDPAVINVSCIPGEKETVYVIRDNGVGFDMRYAQRLFGVFKRLHRTEEFEGTGVGLSIVQRIIQRHGGRVWAEAEVGQGATFSFALPKVNRSSVVAGTRQV